MDLTSTAADTDSLARGSKAAERRRRAYAHALQMMAEHSAAQLQYEVIHANADKRLEALAEQRRAETARRMEASRSPEHCLPVSTAYAKAKCSNRPSEPHKSGSPRSQKASGALTCETAESSEALGQRGKQLHDSASPNSGASSPLMKEAAHCSSPATRKPVRFSSTVPNADDRANEHLRKLTWIRLKQKENEEQLRRRLEMRESEEADRLLQLRTRKTEFVQSLKQTTESKMSVAMERMAAQSEALVAEKQAVAGRKHAIAAQRFRERAQRQEAIRQSVRFDRSPERSRQQRPSTARERLVQHRPEPGALTVEERAALLATHAPRSRPASASPRREKPPGVTVALAPPGELQRMQHAEETFEKLKQRDTKLSSFVSTQLKQREAMRQASLADSKNRATFVEARRTLTAFAGNAHVSKRVAARATQTLIQQPTSTVGTASSPVVQSKTARGDHGNGMLARGEPRSTSKQSARGRTNGHHGLQSCALCAALFSVKNLPHKVTRFTLESIRNSWGVKTGDSDRPVTALYEAELVCVFCCQLVPGGSLDQVCDNTGSAKTQRRSSEPPRSFSHLAVHQGGDNTVRWSRRAAVLAKFIPP
mmetsp:Transcript_4794/g.10443  ORF Transcript_4794/g.10443 Transcript_4794/m.10443 type:complete len:596 (-) Transcript_4794:208-1995(-)